jgi:hypothetical protein
MDTNTYILVVTNTVSVCTYEEEDTCVSYEEDTYILVVTNTDRRVSV